MSSLSFVSSSIVYYLVFKVQLISFETFYCCLESLDAVFGLGHLRCPAPKLSSLFLKKSFGGLKWTRTTDLTLIRRAL